MMTYTKVMRIAVKLCENLNARDIANKISSYVVEREQQDAYNERRTPQTIEKKRVAPKVEEVKPVVEKPIISNLGEKRI